MQWTRQRERERAYINITYGVGNLFYNSEFKKNYVWLGYKVSACQLSGCYNKIY